MRDTIDDTERHYSNTEKRTKHFEEIIVSNFSEVIYRLESGLI